MNNDDEGRVLPISYYIRQLDEAQNDNLCLVGIIRELKEEIKILKNMMLKDKEVLE